MRLFSALDLDDATRERLAAVSRDLAAASGVKWNSPEALHVTLRFFGECAEERLPELTAALERVEPPQRPIEMRLTGLGFLQSERQPRVFVALGEASPELTAFQARVEEAARDLGFDPERREFLAHVTLARIRDVREGRKLVEASRGYVADLGRFAADHWTLYRSETRPQGAVYTRLAEWGFGFTESQ